MAHQKVQIRKNVRAKRNSLDDVFQRSAAISLSDKLSTLPSVMRAKTVALYLANDSELSPSPFIKWCWQHGKQVVLPVLHPFSKGHLLFLCYTPESKMRINCFGIPEPALDVTTVMPLPAIDIIFTPLVAFDDQGHRLGMGGGFYDRTLVSYVNSGNSSNAKARQSVTRSEVIGLAHDCQQVDLIPIEPWDIPLSTIITPTQIIQAKDLSSTL
ncbi:5-formyltetrahydrofolate cyclo-ligase [Thalassotalea euphylliae]|uniref:5-formyltetrahydrofolate cyclo-ligase n=1 Tax=Thalassotalea euphylliae TaxID=1655234 RepID=A0A3E0TWK8_9GAMM|nr:5-formyltetrahydrofolate cyclo-ligase [Thalassotalea euphylliae]